MDLLSQGFTCSLAGITDNNEMVTVYDVELSELTTILENKERADRTVLENNNHVNVAALYTSTIIVHS